MIWWIRPCQHIIILFTYKFRDKLVNIFWMKALLFTIRNKLYNRPDAELYDTLAARVHELAGIWL